MFDTYAEIFRERAADYHHAMLTCPRARDAEFVAALEPIRGMAAGLVCDIPAGGGYLARYLWPGMRYVGVEPAKEFLADTSGPVERLHADITSVPLADRSVDHVVSLAGLHHEPSLPAVFGEMRRLLKAGGRAVIADVAIGTAPAGFLNGFVDEHNPLGHEGRFLDERTAPALAAASFAIVDDAVLSVPWAFADYAEAGEFCRHLFGLTSLDWRQVVEALAEQIGFREEGGQVRLQWLLRRIVAEAA